MLTEMSNVITVGGHGDPSTKKPKSRGTKSKLPSCYEDDAPLFMKHEYGHTPSDVASKPKNMAMAQLQNKVASGFFCLHF